MFTRQLLIVFPDLILCPLFISVCRLSFGLDDAAPLFARPRKESPELNMQWLQRCSYLPPLNHPLIHTPPPCCHLSLPHSHSLVDVHLCFLVVISLKAQEQLVVSEEIQGPAKEFIEFVVKLIPQRQAGVESGIRGEDGRGQRDRRVRRTGMEG